MAGGMFEQALVYLAAGLVAVPIARRAGLGSVIGYLGAGVVIGPSALGLVNDTESVLHFAEFGVVMMLFLVGLELEPSRLWRLRAPIFGTGGMQVVGTALAVGAVALAVGMPWQQAVALGLVLSLSSTAIGLQSLGERGLMHADAGQKSFSVLLFQDIAVIPMLAIFPLLATAPVVEAGAVDGPPGWQLALQVLGAIVATIVAGRFVVPPVMRLVARTGQREMFTAAALGIVIGVTVLMTRVGLSPALGAFLAGVALANSEYRHELEGDVEPFKGLLLGLFFMAVGSSIDLALVGEAPATIAGLVGAVVVGKVGLLWLLARRTGSSPAQAWTFAISLGQIGEFAFVLLAFCAQVGVLPASVTGPFVVVTALSMAVSPLLGALDEKVIQPRLAVRAVSGREVDVADDAPQVIIVGYGRFGQIAGRFLRAEGVGVTVLDVDADQVDVLRKFGQKVFYGDGSRLDLLKAAGAERARVLLVAADDHAKVVETVHVAKRHFPHLQILARARGRTEAYDLIEADIAGVFRETYDTSLRVGVAILERVGRHPHQALRAARLFRKFDERSLAEMAAVRHDETRLVTTARERIAELENILKADHEGESELRDSGWDAEELRKAAQR